MPRKPLSPCALLLLTLLLFTPALSGAVTITGNAFARGQTDHSGIKAVFSRTAPSSLRDSTLTDAAGHYSISLQTGIYTVTFSRDGYFNASLAERSLYSSQTLPNVTLIPFSTRLLVPADFSSIQSAIDASRAADTVLVSPGRYLENINFKGKNIVVGSLFLTTGDTAYVSSTIIDGNKKGHVVEFSSSEDSTAVLCGLTITNGNAGGLYPDNYGGGIYCYTSNPVMMNLKISGNHGYYGGGLYFQQGNAQIRNSIIEKNDADYGGGIIIEYANVSVINTVIRENISYESAVRVWNGQSVFRNIIVNNNHCSQTNPDYFKTFHCYNSNCIIVNSIISNNQGYGIYVDGGNPSISFSVFWNNYSGNIFNNNQYFGANVTTTANGDSCDAYNNIQLDPQFIDPEHGDFRLKDTSPCIGAGTSENAPLTDILGITRGNPPDMGAYENPRDTPMPYVRITSPNGAEIWVTGTTRTITWASFGVAQVRLEYSTDGGTIWKTVVSGIAASAGKYDWVIPDDISARYMVRITDTSDGTITDMSDGVFSVIKGGLADSAWPMYLQNQQHTGNGIGKSPASSIIKWKFMINNIGYSSPAIDKDGILYLGSEDCNLYAVYPDGTLKWKYKTGNSILSSPAIGSDGTIYVGSWDNYLYAIRPDGTLKWKFLTNYRIYSSPSIGSDGTIYITSFVGNLYAINPDGTQKWVNEIGYVTDSSPSIGLDGTIYVGSGDNYLYAFNLNGILKWKYFVEVEIRNAPVVGFDGIIYTGTEGYNVYAINPDGTLKWKYRADNIIRSSPTISPDGTIYVGTEGGNLIALKSDGTVRWIFNDQSTIPFYCSPAIGLDGTVYAGSLNGYFYAINPDGSLRWKFQTGQAIYSSPAISNDGTVYSGSCDSYLYAFAPATLTLTFPNGGEELGSGTQHTITWTSTGTEHVKLEYTTDNGTTWKTISSSTSAATGSYKWTVPAVTSRNCRVRITNTAITSVTDQSEGAFAIILPGVTLTAPNGGEKWISGKTNTITWVSGGVTTVKLEYSKDNGTTWSLIAASVNAADSAYVWTIPDTPSGQCLVRITDTASAARKDASDAVFTILPKPYLRLTAPNGGESWHTTATAYITWESQSVQRVRVEYSLNGGADWTLLAAEAEAALGKLAWTLPGEVFTDCRVCICDASFPALADTSDANFYILAHNVNAGFLVDADLEHSGYQGPGRIESIGGGKNVGFALYAKEWDVAAGITFTFSWDPGKASFRSAISFPVITDDEFTINGKTFTPAPEPNILGGSLYSAWEVSSPGLYTRSYVLLNGEVSSDPDGLIYFAVFRTGSAFTESDTLSIRCAVKMTDRGGTEKDLGAQFFSIGYGLQPPSNFVVSDVPNDQGHSLRLTWTPSPSEQSGMVSYYRIYRSLTSALSDSIKPLNLFTDIKDVTAWEQHAAVLVDSVTSGKIEYTDTAVGLTGVPYYYWIQAEGAGGESAKIAAGIPTAVKERNALPAVFRLGEARPNPFNPSTAIEYSLPKDAFVTLVVYNITGQRVATLLEKPQSAGRYSAVWDARGLPSGIYIYTLRAGEFTGTGKATLLK